MNGWGSYLEGLFRDFRVGLRRLRHNVGYSASSVVALGIGIAGATLLASLAERIVLEPLPVHDIDRVVAIQQVLNPKQVAYPLAYPTFADYRDRLDGIADVAGHKSFPIGLQVGVSRIERNAAAVSGNYFAVLAQAPALGRLIGPADEEPEADPVVVIGYALWRDAFGEDPSVIGRRLDLGAGAATVVGVAPKGFRGHRLDIDEQLWFPLTAVPVLGTGIYASHFTLQARQFPWVEPLARLKPEVTPERLVEGLSRERRAMTEEFGPSQMPAIDESLPLFTVRGLRAEALGADEERLLGFLKLVGILSAATLLVGILNATQLRLAFVERLSAEIGVRRSLGATRAKLVRELAIGSLPLVAAGVAVGWAGAVAMLAALRGFTLPGGVSLARLSSQPDPVLIAAVAAVASCAVLFCGVIPAMLWSRFGPVDLIRRSTRSRRAGALFVATQVALSTVLLVTGGLFVRSFLAGVHTDLGFDPDGLVAVTVSPSAHGTTNVRELAARLYETAKAIPSVDIAAAGSHLPISPHGFALDMIPLGGGERRPGPPIGINTVVGPFATALGMRLVEGRDMSIDDDPESPVGVLDESAASLLFPEGSAVHRYVRTIAMDRDSILIVGVVADARLTSIEERHTPFAFIDARKYAGLGLDDAAHIVVRGRAAPDALLAQLQSALRERHPDLPAVDPRPVSRQVTRAMMPQHLAAILFGIFGVAATLLSATGVAGTVSFELERRRREAGIRAALGATRWTSVRPVLLGSASGTALGLTVGVATVVSGAAWLRAYLFGVSAVDPGAIVTAVLVVAGITVLSAAWVLGRTSAAPPASVLSDVQ